MSGAAEQPPESGATSTATGAEPSFWRLLFTTPLGELVHGRVTGPVQRAVRIEPVVAALPAALADFVADVVRRTRLWPGERREIARELSAHFADGLEAGRTEERLLIDFGDPAQAAKLLRRAAKRNRPWPWRAMRFTFRATAVTLAAIVLIYGAMALRFYLGRPGPITDFRPELNAAALAVKDQEKAWPLYREALLLLPPRESVEKVRFDLDLTRMPMPGEEGWERVESFLQQNAAALQLVRKAAVKPGLGLLVGYRFSDVDAKALREIGPQPEDRMTSPDDPGLIGALVPHLAQMRELANALGYDAQRARAAGDGATAVADIQAMLGIARHCRESPTVIGALVKLAIVGRACDVTNSLLTLQPEVFTDAQLVALAHRLAALDDQSLRIDCSGERIWFKDMLQRIYSDDGRGDGHVTPQGLNWLRRAASYSGSPFDVSESAATLLGGPALNVVMLGRRDMAEQYERLMNMIEADADTPLWQREASRVEEIAGGWLASSFDRWRNLPLALMMPALGRATVNAELCMLRRDATMTAIALELYRREHSDWPARLDELVPSLLPSLPIDRFDGEPLRYRLQDGMPLLYSVGTDREDDRGVLPPLENPDLSSRQWYSQQWLPRAEVERRRSRTTVLSDGRTINEWDGDWLLWPPLPQPPLRRDMPATMP